MPGDYIQGLRVGWCACWYGFGAYFATNNLYQSKWKCEKLSPEQYTNCRKRILATSALYFMLGPLYQSEFSDSVKRLIQARYPV